MTYVLHFAFGVGIGVCVYLTIDGYMATREHRSRFDKETDKYL
jgi:hypothetical protein